MLIQRYIYSLSAEISCCTYVGTSLQVLCSTVQLINMDYCQEYYSVLLLMHSKYVNSGKVVVFMRRALTRFQIMWQISDTVVHSIETKPSTLRLSDPKKKKKNCIFKTLLNLIFIYCICCVCVQNNPSKKTTEKRAKKSFITKVSGHYYYFCSKWVFL